MRKHAQINVVGWLWVGLLLSQLTAVIWAFYKASEVNSLARLAEDAYLLSILKFTIKQALLSTLLSALLAIPSALSLAYSSGRFRRVLLVLLNLCFLTPPLIVVIMIVAIWGNAGWVGRLIPDWNLYGLHGILLAHIFLNWPFLTRLLLQAIESTPVSLWKQALSLRLTHLQVLFLLVYPRLRLSLVYGMGLVFLYCFNSFAIVLSLGGGPGATTLEVAIYQAIKYEFDFNWAAQLAMLQLIISLLVIASSQWLMPTQLARGGHAGFRQQDWKRLLGGWAHHLWGKVLVIYLALPLASLLWVPWLRGARLSVFASAALWDSVFWTLGLTLGVAMVLVPLCFSMMSLRWHYQQWWARLGILTAANQSLLLPSLLTGVGFWLLLHGRVDVYSWAPWLVMLLSVTAFLPLMLQVLWPAYADYRQNYQRLVCSLPLAWQTRWHLLFSALKWPLYRAMVMLLLLTSGEVGLIALFGNADFSTLSWHIYQLMGQYRMADAALIACAQMLMLGSLFWWVEARYETDL